MGDDDTVMSCSPGQHARVILLSDVRFLHGESVKRRETSLQSSENTVIKILVNEQRRHRLPRRVLLRRDQLRATMAETFTPGGNLRTALKLIPQVGSFVFALAQIRIHRSLVLQVKSDCAVNLTQGE